jgi:endoglucanase
MVTGAGDAEFTVRRAGSNETILRARLGPAVPDADSGDVIRIADFSALTQPGDYVLALEGAAAAPAVRIAEDVFARAFYLAARSFYGQRCGTAVDLGPSFAGYAHAACHVEGTPNPDAELHASSGRSGRHAGTGGWHDAGDYGKYVVNSGISTGQLLWAYEWYSDRVGRMRLDLPESGDATPDLLDEARFNLDWMLSMMDGDGGVWHKLTSERFGSFVMPEKDDGGPRYVIGTGAAPFKGTCATADHAAVAAIAGRVYRPFDGAFSGRSLSAARRAFSWARANTGVAFRNFCGVVTGEYGDTQCGDELLWAAAELFRTTGEPAYGEYVVANYARGGPVVSANEYPQDWRNVKNLALWTYARAPHASVDAGVRQVIRADTLAAADAIVARTQQNGYRVSLRPDDYIWGSNGGVANFGVLMLAAEAFAPEPRYLQTALDNLHYLLGRNTHGVSFLTGVGTRPVRRIHHRPSGADANAEPWPGLLSGGPNRYGGDPVIDALPATPPARRYRDDQASYASNENAINWNAPLVFLLASLLPDPAR